MRIPEEIISQISAATDIVSVISETVMLKKSGMNYFGLCPFHSEKTSSFSVSPHKQIFYCFGCGAGGNVFSYLMKYHGITFPEAVKMAGAKCGIAVETGPVTPEQERHLALRERLYRLNQQVMVHYSRLLCQSPSGEPARKYLEARGIGQGTIEQLNLGLSLNRWDDMVLFLKQKKVSKALAEASGFVIKRREKAGYYDRFRNRIMFPIFDVTRQVAGFGGRVMDDKGAKYLNSPETPVYLKSRILYGFHLSKAYCRREDAVYIVEGYFDFISLFQYGIKNCVATLGTALSESHVRLLKGAASKAYLVFDSDKAGINAAKRSISTFLKEGMDVSIIVLPQGQDPDSFVQRRGKEAFEAYARKAMPVIPFLTRSAMEQFGLSVEGKIKILEEMKVPLARVEDPAARSLYIHELSQTLGIDESAVLEKVRMALQASENVPRTAAVTPEHRGGAGEGTSLEEASMRREKQMVSMMMHFPQIRKEIRSRGVLDCFFSRQLKEIGQCVLEIEDDDQMVSRVMERVETDAQRRLVASLSMADIPDVDDVYEKSVFLMSRIVKIRNKNENDLTSKIKRAEQGSNSSLSFDLLAKRQREIRKLRGYE